LFFKFCIFLRRNKKEGKENPPGAHEFLSFLDEFII